MTHNLFTGGHLPTAAQHKPRAATILISLLIANVRGRSVGRVSHQSPSMLGPKSPLNLNSAEE